MENINENQNLTREQIEEVFIKSCETFVSLESDRIDELYKKMRYSFDEYVNELVLDAFYQGYICGKASK